MVRRLSLALAVLATLVAAAGWWLAVDARQRAARANRDLASAQEELRALREEVERLREQPPGAGDDALGGLFEGLLDGALEGAPGQGDPFGDLLGELLGEGGALGGLLGGDALELAACVAGGGPPGDGLFGGTTTADRSASIEEQIAAVTDAVAELRELRVRSPITPTFLPPEEFRARIAALLRAGYPPEEARRDGLILAALGAVPDGTDMRALVEQAVSDQAAGFYRPETDELVVRAPPDQRLSPTARVILAHEIEHALADQHFGLPTGDRPDPERADAALAELALIEGDATLTMQRYAVAHLSFGEQLAMATDPAVLGAQADLDELPYHLVRQLTFPYLDGMAFVCDLHGRGGWAAIDRAYAARPTTTAQILFPERYGREDAADPGGPAESPPGWVRERSSSFGAAELLWLLEAPGGDTGRALEDPRRRVGEWAGGRLTLLTRGSETAVAVALVDRPGGDRLCGTLTAWAEATWPASAVIPVDGMEVALDGGIRDVVVACSSDGVRVGIAPDLDTARTLAR